MVGRHLHGARGLHHGDPCDGAGAAVRGARGGEVGAAEGRSVARTPRCRLPRPHIPYHGSVGGI